MDCEHRHSMAPVSPANKYCKVFFQDQVHRVNSRMCHRLPNSTSTSAHSIFLWRYYRYSCPPRDRTPPRRGMMSYYSKELPSEWSVATDHRQSDRIVAILAKSASMSAQGDSCSLDPWPQMLLRHRRRRKMKKMRHETLCLWLDCCRK